MLVVGCVYIVYVIRTWTLYIEHAHKGQLNVSSANIKKNLISLKTLLMFASYVVWTTNWSYIFRLSQSFHRFSIQSKSEYRMLIRIEWQIAAKCITFPWLTINNNFKDVSFDAVITKQKDNHKLDPFHWKQSVMVLLMFFAEKNDQM